MRDAFLVLYLTDAAHVIEAFGAKLGRGPRTREMEPLTWVLTRLGREISGTELTAAIAQVQEAQWAMARFHDVYDVLVSPVIAAPPLPLDSGDLTRPREALIRRFIACSCPAHIDDPSPHVAEATSGWATHNSPT